MVIKNVVYTEKFERSIKSIKDGTMKQRVKKTIEKIIENPEIGKPLRFDLKGERTVYIKPYRLIYAVENENIVFLRFMHRNDVYK